MNRTLTISLILVSLTSVLACSKNADGASAAPTSSTLSAKPKRYDARGVIKAFAEGKKSVNIAHEEIPGFMKAMTMPFDVSSPAVLDGLKEGDAVEFSFTEESGGSLLIQSIKKR